MSFKNYDWSPRFLDLEFEWAFGTSRTQQLLKAIDSHIDGEPIDALLKERYPMDHSKYGNKTYLPLMLLKALSAQKLFGITSGPAQAYQINNRLSFKSFPGLPFSEPAPDH